MCQQCADNMRKHLPEIPEDEWVDFLMEFTCYPFGSAQMVEEQITTEAYKQYFRDERRWYEVNDKDSRARLAGLKTSRYE
jgi:hypothetical protein